VKARRAIALLACSALLWSAGVSAQSTDPAMERVLAQPHGMFAKDMQNFMNAARPAFDSASVAAQVCDKERIEVHRHFLEILQHRMEAEQSSWLPPYSDDFDPNLWSYVHIFIMHAKEQAAAWLRVDCTFPNVPINQQYGTTQTGSSGQPPPDIADDINAWSHGGARQGFESAEFYRLRGDCDKFHAELDRIEGELRGALHQADSLADAARYQRLWRYFVEEVRDRPCPVPKGAAVTTEQRLMEQRAERARAPRPLPPPFEMVPHQHYSPPSPDNATQHLERANPIDRYLRKRDKAPPKGTETPQPRGETGDMSGLPVGPLPPRAPPDDPMQQITPSTDQPPPESILDEVEDVGPAGDLAYENPALERASAEFSAAVRACDLKAFLAARERYLAELRRILSNPHLEAAARAHFEQKLKEVQQTKTPIRLSCPVVE
jgi:hypothetical protein